MGSVIALSIAPAPGNEKHGRSGASARRAILGSNPVTSAFVDTPDTGASSERARRVAQSVVHAVHHERRLNDEGPAFAGPPRSRSACLQGSCKSYALVGLDSGGGIRTRDLRVMSPTSYQTAPPRVASYVLAKNGPPDLRTPPDGRP